MAEFCSDSLNLEYLRFCEFAVNVNFPVKVFIILNYTDDFA